MYTLIKLSFKNIFEKKFRSFLIVLSVALSVALLYTIISLSTTITGYYESSLNKTIGDTDIVLSANDSSASSIMEKLDQQSDLFTSNDYDYAVPVLEGYGYYLEDTVAKPVKLTSMTLLDFNKVFDTSFSEQNENDFQGNKLLIGESTSESLSLKKGDTLTLTIGGSDYNFTIWDVHSDYNLLASSNSLQSIIMPYQTFESILNSSNITTSYQIAVSGDQSSKSIETSVHELQTMYSNYSVEKANDSENLSAMLNIIQVSLSLMTMSVLIVSCFIIFSSFKIIIIERMAFVGTLRSLGSTIKSSRKILVMESIFYGIIGGISGILLGLLALDITISQIMSLTEIENIGFQLFHPTYALLVLGLSILLVLFSSMLPIRRLSKTSVKSLLFTEVKNTKHFSISRSIIGTILIAVGFYLVKTKVPELQMPFSFVGILFTTIGSAMIVPTLVVILRKPLAFVLTPFVGYHSKAASTQLTNDKTLMNNIILLAMGLGIILMINTFSSSVGSLVVDVYSKSRADIILMYQDFDEEYVNQVSAIEGVTHTYATRDLFEVTANGNIPLPILEGIDTEYAAYAWDEFGEVFTPEFNRTFESERTIIITNLLATKHDLKIDDTLAIEFEQKTVNYRIITIVPSIMNNGNMSFIHTDFFKEDSGINTYKGLYINTDQDPELIAQKVKEISPLAMYPIETLKSMKEFNQESNDSLFGLMKAVSLIAMLIGVVGIFNNYVISFMSRRKFLASLRSLGVNKQSLMKLFLSESLIGGLVGSISGISIGIILLQMMKLVLINMNISSSMVSYQYGEFIFVGIAGLVLSVISSLIPAIMSLKRPIVPELKYD